MHIKETTHNFIGREQELQIFKEWLTTSDGEAPWILHFYDALELEAKKGGVGKTWLLQQCAELARKVYPDIVVASIDFFNIGQREAAVIADRVVDALKAGQPAWSSPEFDATLREYRDAIQAGDEDLIEIRTRLADALTADFHRLEEQLHQERKYLLVFFDTYELVEQNPLISVLRLSQAFPDNYNFGRIGVVIAGRNPIDWTQSNWRGREHEVQSVPLAPFTQAEMLHYFAAFCSASPPGAQLAEVLYSRTAGRPILIGLVSDVLNHRIASFEDLAAVPEARFEENLVTQVNYLQRPIDMVILIMAHVYHRFNFDLLQWIRHEPLFHDRWQERDPEELFRELLQLSFVRHPNESTDFVLHDEMRPLIVKYCWDAQDPDQRYRKAISGRVIEYYEHQLATTDREQLRQAYTVEMLYHKLYLDLDQGYAYFEKQFSNAVKLWLSAFARSLLQEAKKFASTLSPIQQYDLEFFEAKLLQIEESAVQALAIYQELEQKADAHWLEARLIDIVYEKGVCYQQLSSYTEAITCFTTAKDMEKAKGNISNYASILDWLGSVYRRQGQLDTALRYFEESIEIHKNAGTPRPYASVLNSVSYVYRLQGKVDEALRRAKLAWRIRSDLFKQDKMSEVYVGWCLNAIGEVYFYIDDFAQAEHAFQQAYEIFSRTGHKKGIAAMYIRFGQMQMMRQNLTEAQQWFQRGYNAALGVDSEAQINSLNKQGWVFVLNKDYQAAEPFFQQAIDLARKVHDEYQEAESLIDLSTTLRHQRHYEEAHTRLQEAETICQRYNYNYLLGIARESEGYIKSHTGDYHGGFLCYAEACHYMARFNAVKYNKILRTLTDALFEIPRAEIIPCVDILINYWRSYGLEQDYPELVSSCEEVRALVAI